MAYLKPLDKNSRQMDLPTGEILSMGWELAIGRDATCGLHINSAGISRIHAKLQHDGRNYVIADQDSTNGTLLIRSLNHVERRISLSPFRAYALQSGDVIELGKVNCVRFQDGPIEIGPNQSGPVDNPLAEVTMGPGEGMTVSPLQEVISGILEISRTLASIFKEEEMGPLVMNQMMRIFPKGQRFLLFATVPKTNRLRVLAWKINQSRRRNFTNPDDDDNVPRYSRTIYRMVVEERKSVILTDTDSEISSSMSMIDMGIRSIMCAPIEAPDGRVLGMLQIDADQKSKFQRSELEILKVIAQQVGATMHMADLHRQAILQTQMQAEMKHASEIARQFLPHGVPEIPGYEFFAEYKPAEDVGGDFYDFNMVSPDRMAISVCDVVGHGISAALIMARLSSDLRHVLRQVSDPSQAFERLDSILMPVLSPPDSFDCRYISMSMALLNLKSARMTVVNAGHPPLIIRRNDGPLDTPDKSLTGRLIGVDFGDIQFKLSNPFEAAEVQLHPGDIVVYYSDGVTEARNKLNEFFGSPDFRMLAKALKETKGGPKAVGQAIMKSFKAFTDGIPQADDVTLLCFGPTLDFQPSADN
ncbi:MAG: SpoIIE family protein phosphatase [Planctomycetota bacterium]|nr:SpoIIE family protein phosphatase [Planctomycetota bacterium]